MATDDDALIRRARRSRDEKQERGVYTPELLESLAEPLDLRPDPSAAAGPAWPEALATATVSVQQPPPSSRPALGPALTATKRAIERALRWYLPPVTEQITRHNRAVLDVLAEHNRQIVELHAELEALRRRVAALEAKAPAGPRAE